MKVLPGPALALYATRVIHAGDQVLYDYGIQVPWKNQVSYSILEFWQYSAIHKKHPHMKESLANLICHNVNNATRCYRVTERVHSSVAALKELAETIRTPADHENSSHITAAVPKMRTMEPKKQRHLHLLRTAVMTLI